MRTAPVVCEGLAVPGEGRAAGERLEAADVAASADDALVVGDLDVADVACAALGAAMEHPPDHDAGADPGSDLDEHDVLVTPRDAGADLASAITFTSLSTQMGTAYEAKCPRRSYWSQPGMIGGATGRPDSNSTGPGTPIPIPSSDPGSSSTSARHCSSIASTRPSTTSGPCGDVSRLARVREDRARQVDHRDVDARRAEVGDEEVPGRRAEAHGARRPTTRRRADLAALEEASLDELADPLDDDGAAEARRGRELRPCGGAVRTDVVEDRGEPGRSARARARAASPQPCVQPQ